MKKIFIGIAAIVAISLGSACKKFLDQAPLDKVSLDQFYKSRMDIDAGIAGMYSAFQQMMIGESQFRNRYTHWGEARSDNYMGSGYAGNTEIENEMNSLSAGNTWTDWTPLYITIGRANLNIKFIPRAAEFESQKALVTPQIINDYLAQSYAMRAICYFYVVRLWGDAPIRVEPYLDTAEDPEKPRESSEKIFNEIIIPDLEKAYSLITKNATPNVFYIGEGAICAALADVYMWRKDYPNAIKWFGNLKKAKAPTGKVFGGTSMNDLQPKASWNSQFVTPASSPESIWNIHWDFTKNACACMAGASAAVNNAPIVIDIFLFNQWRADQNTKDIRKKATFDFTKLERDRVWKYYLGAYAAADPTLPAGSTGTYTVAATDRATDDNVYPVMYRLSDQYLLYAEALNKTGRQAESLQYLNFIRVRAGLDPYTAASAEITTNGVIDADKLEDAILEERHIELFAEGKRWFDLVRTDHVIKVMDPIVRQRQVLANIPADQVTGWGSDKRRYLLPINRKVLNSSSKLYQNPPYTD